MLAALRRYQIIAYVVGVGLIILVLVGVPLQIWANNESVVKVVGPLHGALYVVYLLLTLDLARRVRMNPVVAVLVMVAGTIPFLSFVAERKVTAMVKAPQTREPKGLKPEHERSTNPHVADTRS